MSLGRKTGPLLAALGAITIAGLTLVPIPHQADASARTSLTCIACGEQGGVDIILNLALFVPLGLGLRLSGWPWRRVVLTAGLFSLAVEALQFFIVTGRDASLGDLVTNTTGGALGAALVGWLGTVAFPSAVAARRLLAGGAAVWLGLLALSAWLQQPATTDGALASAWAHRVRKFNPFEGQVSAVTLDGVAMPPDGPPPEAALIRTRLERGELRLAVSAISGRPITFGGWIYMILAAERPQLALVQRKRNAIIAVPARALRYKLRTPMLSLPDGFPHKPGIPVALEGGRRGPHLWLAASYAGESASTELALSPAHGWGLIAPFGIALGPGVRLITAGFLALLSLPLGYWSAATGRPVPAAAVLGLTLAAGLGLVPALGGYVPVHWSEWLAGGLGAAAGWALRRPAAYLQPRCGSPSVSVSSSS